MERADRVFLDTSELYPFTVMDVLLTMAEELRLTWVWTDELLDEWERVIVEDGLRTTDAARSVHRCRPGGFRRVTDRPRPLPAQGH